MSDTSKTCIIVDDEAGSRNNLALLIKEYLPEIEILGMAANAVEARALLDLHQPDILFLDIQMPGEDGFDLLDSLNHRDFSLIFVTAYQEYALRAIKASAVDYVLKPVNIGELKDAVEKCIKHDPKTATKISSTYTHSIENLLKDLESQTFPENITLPSHGTFVIKNVASIRYLEASGNYTVFNFSENEELIVAKTLKYFEEVLDPMRFFRINRSTIVNFDFWNAMSPSKEELIQADGTRLSISRRRKKEVELALTEYQERR